MGNRQFLRACRAGTLGLRELLPIPDISNKRFPETQKHEAKGLLQIMYRMSPDDYRGISQIWRGQHPEDGTDLRVVDGPPEGGRVPLYP